MGEQMSLDHASTAIGMMFMPTKASKGKGPACGDSRCCRPSGIHDDGRHSLSSLTFGRGELDDLGYWEIPCYVCTRDFEKNNCEAFPGEDC